MRDQTSSLPHIQKALTIENAMHEDLCSRLSNNFNKERFIPYVIMHEFEGMLFSNCNAFASGIAQTNLSSRFQAIRDQFNSPEEINDSPLTAPSKRILKIFPSYQKPLYGSLAALEIGIDKIKSECSHFSEWLQKLININNS